MISLPTRSLPDMRSYPPPSAQPTVPLEILPDYLRLHGCEVVGMDKFGRLVVQPKSQVNQTEV